MAMGHSSHKRRRRTKPASKQQAVGSSPPPAPVHFRGTKYVASSLPDSAIVSYSGYVTRLFITIGRHIRTNADTAGTLIPERAT
jgi:hypothetical protein